MEEGSRKSHSATPPVLPVLPRGDQAIVEICSSVSFQKAPLLRELLMYLWRNRDKSVSEYAIGADILSRKPDFDPTSDATVRVHISRLRKRLSEYYESEGARASLRLQIPVGTHHLVLVEPPKSQPEAPPAKGPSPGNRVRPVLVATLSLLLLVTIDDWRLRRGLPNEQRLETIHPFWQPMLQRGNSVHIIVQAPVFFGWTGKPYIARDSGVNQPDAIGQSPMLHMLERSFGKPVLSRSYTVASDTAAISLFMKYLQNRGVGATILDTQAATPDVVESRNSIVLIGPGSVTQLLQNFYMEASEGAVVNRSPRPGEPAEWPVTELGPLRFTHYGIIASVPGKAAGTRFLLLVSNYNLNLASMLTTGSETDKLEAFRKANGAPDSFEMVVRFERNGDKLLQSAPVAFRAVRGS